MTSRRPQHTRLALLLLIASLTACGSDEVTSDSSWSLDEPLPAEVTPETPPQQEREPEEEPAPLPELKGCDTGLWPVTAGFVREGDNWQRTFEALTQDGVTYQLQLRFERVTLLSGEATWAVHERRHLCLRGQQEGHIGYRVRRSDLLTEPAPIYWGELALHDASGHHYSPGCSQWVGERDDEVIVWTERDATISPEGWHEDTSTYLLDAWDDTSHAPEAPEPLVIDATTAFGLTITWPRVWPDDAPEDALAQYEQRCVEQGWLPEAAIAKPSQDPYHTQRIDLLALPVEVQRALWAIRTEHTR